MGRANFGLWLWTVTLAFLLCACRAATASSPSHAPSVHEGILDAAFKRYLALCRLHQVVPSADALISLKLGSQDLAIRPSAARPFGDLELWVLSTLLEDDDGAKLGALRSADFSACSLGPSGALVVARLLGHPACRIEVLDLSNQGIGRHGISAIMQAVGSAPSMRELGLASCGLGDSSETVLEYLRRDRKARLKKIDLQNNFIGFKLCSSLVRAAQAAGVEVQLDGNRVLDEVFNALSHGLGVVLAAVGTLFLFRKIRQRPLHYHVSCGLYCASLFLLYLASTLYHSLFALGRTTVYVFSILDYSGIFLLIAGTYSPFLGILLRDTWFGTPLLATMWLAAVTGICTAAFYRGPFATQLRLSLYLVMGWACVASGRLVPMKLGLKGSLLLLAGGVLYTAGVPFFLRNRHQSVIPDHTVWHLFVVCASAAHYASIWHVVSSTNAPFNCEQKLDAGGEMERMAGDELSQADYMPLMTQPL